MKNLLILFVFLVGITSLLADSIDAPCDYAEVSSNGEFVFVMLVPDGAPRIKDYRNSGHFEGIESIRSIYSQSGLYRKDDSGMPVWTVDWYAREVLPCSDGIHLIRFGPWASKYGDEALSFFANGELLKGYRIDELVKFPKRLPHSVSHFKWRSSDILVSDEKKLELRTPNGEFYVFEVATGQILESFRPAQWTARAVQVSAFFLLVLFLSWLLWMLWKRSSENVS